MNNKEEKAYGRWRFQEFHRSPWSRLCSPWSSELRETQQRKKQNNSSLSGLERRFGPAKKSAVSIYYLGLSILIFRFYIFICLIFFFY